MVAVVLKKKTKLIGFQTDEDMHRRVVRAAREKGFDTYADWMRGVVSDQLEGHDAKPNGYQGDILAHLGTIYAGHIAPKLAANVAQLDQPALLHDLLVHLQECFASGAKRSDIVLVPRWALAPAHPWHKPAPEAAPHAQTSTPTTATAADLETLDRLRDVASHALLHAKR